MHSDYYVHVAREERKREMESVQAVENIKAATVSKLVTEFDFTMEDAAEAVERHSTANPDSWHENSDVENLARDIADELDEE